MSSQQTHRQAKKERIQPLSFLALLGILWIATVPSPPSALAQDPSCTADETLTPGSILRRHHETPPAGSELVRVPVAEPGVLELYVSGGVRAVPPRISFLGMAPSGGIGGESTSCGSSTGEDVSWVRIRETPRELQLLIRKPDDVFVSVSSENPGVPLTDYALHATFAAESSVPDEVIALTVNPPADCQPDDLPTFSPEPFAESRFVVLRRDGFTKDVDPWDDDVITGTIEEPGVLVVEAPDAPLNAALHDGDACTLGYRMAEGALDGSGAFVAAPVHAGMKRLVLAARSAFDVWYEVSIRHFALCADGVDDHSDRPLCATELPWARDVAGAVTGDDEDHFTFTLAGQETVAVDLAGGDGVRGVLYDEDGQRLETLDAGQALVRTLGPGRFYVLVAGVDGWVGEYGIRLTLMR